MQDAVLTDSVDADAGHQPVVQVGAVDRGPGFGGLLVHQDVPVRGVRPRSAAMLEPRRERLVGHLAQALLGSGEGDPPVGQVQVLEEQFADRGGLISRVTRSAP